VADGIAMVAAATQSGRHLMVDFHARWKLFMGAKSHVDRGDLGAPVTAYEPIRYFVDCVADTVTPEASGRDGLIVTAMIESTRRSLAEKRPVRIAEVLEDGDASNRTDPVGPRGEKPE